MITGIDETEDATAASDATQPVFEVNFEEILSTFQKSFEELSNDKSKRVYVTCSKEYIDSPNKSWWRILLVDAILTAFNGKIPNRSNGHFDSHAALRAALSLAIHAAPPSTERIESNEDLCGMDTFNVVNIPIQWLKINTIYDEWSSYVASNVNSNNNHHREKRNRLRNVFLTECTGLEDSFSSVIKLGLSNVLDKMYPSLNPNPHSATQSEFSYKKKRNRSNASAEGKGKKRLLAAAEKRLLAAAETDLLSETAAFITATDDDSEDFSDDVSALIASTSAALRLKEFEDSMLEFPYSIRIAQFATNNAGDQFHGDIIFIQEKDDEEAAIADAEAEEDLSDEIIPKQRWRVNDCLVQVVGIPVDDFVDEPMEPPEKKVKWLVQTEDA